MDHVADQGREVDQNRDQVADRDRDHENRAQDLNRVLERVAQGRGRNLDRDHQAAVALDHDLSRNLDRSRDQNRKQKRPTYFVKSDRSPPDRDRKRNREVDPKVAQNREINLESRNRDQKVEKSLKVDQRVDQKIDRKVEIDQNLKVVIAEDRNLRAPPGWNGKVQIEKIDQEIFHEIRKGCILREPDCRNLILLLWKFNKPIENALVVRNDRDPEVVKDREVGDDLQVEKDPGAENDPEAVNDREVEKDQKVEIDRAVAGDQMIVENDHILEIVQFHESVYLYQEYEDHNEGQGQEMSKGQMIDQEIDHVIDQTIIQFMIEKNRRKEKEANHVIRSLIENDRGKFFNRGSFFTVRFLLEGSKLHSSGFWREFFDPWESFLEPIVIFQYGEFLGLPFWFTVLMIGFLKVTV